ncbi:hypothetical protein [Streptomyces sp. NBC_00343]|uniref:hypothetical protein n=1 Tax=Streptomyces sp. NBC_00343 TaxID=2975719 RepID=UPI002E287B0C|nr:hypothetical protein [Streptomyces sp. NBC_00343]
MAPGCLHLQQADIAFADQHAAHGSFRAWAKVTAHCHRPGRPRIGQDLLRWAFSRLAV